MKFHLLPLLSCYSWKNMNLKAHFRKFCYFSLDSELRANTISFCIKLPPKVQILPLLPFPPVSISHFPLILLSRYLGCPYYWFAFQIQSMIFLHSLSRLHSLRIFKPYSKMEPQSKIVSITLSKPTEIEEKMENSKVSLHSHIPSFLTKEQQGWGFIYFSQKAIAQLGIIQKIHCYNPKLYAYFLEQLRNRRSYITILQISLINFQLPSNTETMTTFNTMISYNSLQLGSLPWKHPKFPQSPLLGSSRDFTIFHHFALLICVLTVLYDLWFQCLLIQRKSTFVGWLNNQNSFQLSTVN